MTLLRVEGLSLRLDGRLVVDDVSLSVDAGRRLAVLGPSGSGKTQTILAILGLSPTGATGIGSVSFGGLRLDELDDAGWSSVRGARIGAVFQDPSTTLDPTMRVGRQIAIPLRLHRALDRRSATEEAARWCERVGLPPRTVDAYPHQLSGGQRQRAAIAIALAGEPDLLVADEPTSSLDSTVQRDVLDLLDSLVAERRLALILVTHDLAVAARASDDLMVMVGGRVVESGPTASVLRDPRHDVTRSLVASARRSADALARASSGGPR